MSPVPLRSILVGMLLKQLNVLCRVLYSAIVLLVAANPMNAVWSQFSAVISVSSGLCLWCMMAKLVRNRCFGGALKCIIGLGLACPSGVRNVPSRSTLFAQLCLVTLCSSMAVGT